MIILSKKRIIRLKVKPGVTGYTQAYYRNSIDQETKLQYDAYYAQNITFIGDIKIVFKTIESVLLRRNIYIQEKEIKDVHEVK